MAFSVDNIAINFPSVLCGTEQIEGVVVAPLNALFVTSNLFIINHQQFYVLLIVSTLLLLLLAVRLRLCKSKKKQRDLQLQVELKTREVEEEKKEIIKNIEIIEAQNREKDVLINEIHHRVKNNLQYISSMVDIQRIMLPSEEGKRVLGEVQRRISSMSLVHEMLYSSGDLSQIEARDYLKPLVDSINRMVNVKQLPIQIKTRVCLLKMSVSDCTSLGMITSEAISNSIKYAFEGVEDPKITVDLFHNKDHSMLTLRIRDNGVGIENKYLEGTSNTFGIKLMKIFTEQLKGSCKITNREGTEVSISFNDRNYEDSDL